MSSSNPELILFTFPESVYGRRIIRYLNLRNIPFTRIRVPPRLPRPILSEKLGIQYRRIPILAIGRDIYIDTRLILRKLESLGDIETRLLGATEEVNSFESGFLEILEEFIIDGGPFWRAAGLIPTDSELASDPEWMKDRFEGSGGAFTLEALESNRTWCLSQMRLYFGMFEKMLGDGRKFVLGGEVPGMAEIHAGWVFDWVVGMCEGVQGVYAPKKDLRVFGEERFPRVWAWVRRFREVDDVAARRNESGTSGLREGVEAEAEIVERILNAQIEHSQELSFDEDDVLNLKKGQRISVAPTDFGAAHKDEGALICLTENEVVIESAVPGKQGVLRLHYPRINFKILPVP